MELTDAKKIAGICLLILVLVIMFDGKDGESGTSSSSSLSHNERLAPESECRRVNDILGRLVTRNNGAVSNPSPGKLYLPAHQWAVLDEHGRTGLARGLAIQSGCAYDLDPLYQSVEIRDVASNRLLASGPVWKLKDR